MHGIQPIRQALEVDFHLPRNRAEELAIKISEITSQTSSADAALLGVFGKEGLKKFPEAARTRLLYKIDLYLALLDMEGPKTPT